MKTFLCRPSKHFMPWAKLEVLELYLWHNLCWLYKCLIWANMIHKSACPRDLTSNIFKSLTAAVCWSIATDKDRSMDSGWHHPKSKLLPLHLLHNLHGCQAFCKVLQYIDLPICGLKLCLNYADDTLTKCIHNMCKGLWTSHSKTQEKNMELLFLPTTTPPPHSLGRLIKSLWCWKKGPICQLAFQFIPF